MINVGNLTGTVSPFAQAVLRYVIGPIAAQTISGTVKCQMRGSESNAGANATPAIAVKLIKPDGTDRSVLLIQTASDSATVGNEFKTTLTNATFKNVAEIAAMTLTPQTATAGDYLVIELGFRSATTTQRTVNLSYGDNSATDLLEDTTTTAANNPWVEFSADIPLLHTASAAPTAGAATCAGTATFTPFLAATATGTATVGAATASASGQAAYHPTIKITQAHAHLSGRRYGSFAGRTSAPAASFGTISITIGAAVGSGAGHFGLHPVARITQAHLHLSGQRYSSFANRLLGPYVATAALTVGAATASASSQSVSHPVVRITQAHLQLSGRRYGSFVGKVADAAYTATIDVTIGAVSGVASGQFGHHPVAEIVQPTYALRSRRYGTFANKGGGPFVGVGAATTAAATASGAATLTPPVYTATADVTAAAAAVQVDGQASFTGFEFTGDADVTIAAATASGAATFAVPVYTATAAITIGAALGAGFEPALRSASAAVSLAPVTVSALGTTIKPVYAAVGVVLVGAATAAGEAATFATHGVGKITQPHYHLSGRRYGSFAHKRVTETPALGTGDAHRKREENRQQRVKKRREREAVELVLMGML